MHTTLLTEIGLPANFTQHDVVTAEFMMFNTKTDLDTSNPHSFDIIDYKYKRLDTGRIGDEEDMDDFFSSVQLNSS